MNERDTAWLRHQQARWMRPDAHRWLRPDAARFLKPGTDPAAFFAAYQRKFNPHQLRVPKGNPDGGQWTREGGNGNNAMFDGAGGINDPRVLSDVDPETIVPGAQYAQTGKLGRTGGFSPDRDGWHDYQTENLVCPAHLSCSPEEFADQLARFSVPGRDTSKPVENEKDYPVFIPGTDVYVGNISTRVSNDGLTITNRTEKGHIFFDGVVERRARRTEEGDWYVTTRGFGNNLTPGMNIVNRLFGPQIFNGLDQQMRLNIRRHHGKGLTHLAMAAVASGDIARLGHDLLGEYENAPGF